MNNDPTPDSPEALNVRIAALCGWKRAMYIDTYEGGSGRIRWKRPDGTWAGSTHDPADNCHIPNYSGSLDAMHEAEQVLTYQEHVAYWNQITRYTRGVGIFPGEATAHQRAQAFLTIKEARRASS